MLEALKGGKPDMVPAAPCYLNLYLENFMGRYYLERYRRRIGKQTRLPIDHDEDTHFRANAFYQAFGIFEETFDWLPVLSRGSSYKWARSHYVERVDEDYFFADRRNQQRLSFKDSLSIVLSPGMGTHEEGNDLPGYPSAGQKRDLWDLSGELSSLADVDAAIPIVSTDELTSHGVFELPRQIVEDYGERCFLYTSVIAPFSNVYYVVGFAGCMMMIYDRPNLLHRIMERKMAQSMEFLKGLAKLRVHGVWIIETRASADLISPQHFIEFALPYEQALVNEIKALGMATILYFCGDAIPRLELIRSLGVDAIALEESKKTFQINIKEIVDRVGDVACIFGNIDAIKIMAEGTPETIEEEVKRQIHVGKRAHGFIVGIGSPLPPTTNPRNVDAFVRAVRRYGQL